MEIGNSNNPELRNDRLSGTRTAGPARSGNAADGRGAAAPQAPGAGAADRVTLTDTAQSLLKLRGGGASEAPVDRQRVEAIRRSLRDGSYAVNAEKIAEALIRQDNG